MQLARGLLAVSETRVIFRQDPDDLVPDGVRAHVVLTGGRRIGDWVNPQPVRGEHAMGLMQFLPSTWRVEATAAPGQPRDPYQPAAALLKAGSYLHRLQTGAAGGVPCDLRGALAVYGGSLAYADQVLSLAQPPEQVARCRSSSRSRRPAGSSGSRRRGGRPTSPRT